jgi:hypothetical protein
MTDKIDLTIAPRGNYVLLSADSLRLLLPQSEVGASEYLEGTLEASNEPGLLQQSGTTNARRFVALSAQMTPLSDCPPDRFLVVTLDHENDHLGWCWKEQRVLIDVELQPKPIPSVLLAPDTPVSHYVDLDGKPAYLCSAQQVRAFAFAARS